MRPLQDRTAERGVAREGRGGCDCVKAKQPNLSRSLPGTRGSSPMANNKEEAGKGTPRPGEMPGGRRTYATLDLTAAEVEGRAGAASGLSRSAGTLAGTPASHAGSHATSQATRSEERRVGKEERARPQ